MWGPPEPCAYILPVKSWQVVRRTNCRKDIVTKLVTRTPPMTGVLRITRAEEHVVDLYIIHPIRVVVGISVNILVSAKKYRFGVF